MVVLANTYLCRNDPYGQAGLRRRIHKATPKGGSEWHVWAYYYDTSWWVLEEQYDSGPSDPTETNLQPNYQYVWGLRYIDAPVLRDENIDDDNLCDDERLFYLNDANFNITALVNRSGTVVERCIPACLSKTGRYAL